MKNKIYLEMNGDLPELDLQPSKPIFVVYNINQEYIYKRFASSFIHLS